MAVDAIRPLVAMVHYTPSMRSEAVEAKTGKDWDAWFKALDRWGAVEKGHKATAAYLQEEHGVPGWWAQCITVEFERARGVRQVGQKSDGAYAVSAQRTIAAGVDEAMAYWSDGRKRRRWLHDEVLAGTIAAGLKTARRSKTAMGETIRFDVMPRGAPTKQVVQVTFTDLGDRTQVRLQHEGIPDKPERDALKARWSPMLDDLKRVAEA